MRGWLLARVAQELGADPLAIDPGLPPAFCGLAPEAEEAITRELERRIQAGNCAGTRTGRPQRPRLRGAGLLGLIEP